MIAALSLSAVLVAWAPVAAFAETPAGARDAAAPEYIPDESASAKEYTPDEDIAKYIDEIIAAGLLTSDVYSRPLDSDILRADLAKYVMDFYRFLGGADPGAVGDYYLDTDDPNAENAYALGLFDGNDGYFDPDEDVDKDEAVTALAKAVIAANPAEKPGLPSAGAALASLRMKYTDADSIDVDALPYIGFMDSRGALLPERFIQPGELTYLDINYSQSLEEFLLTLSDAVWAFAKSRVSPHAVKPAAPKASEYQRYFASAFKNNTYLYWGESPGAYSYSVNVFISKKLKAKLQTGYASLTLNKTSSPTYTSVFGDTTKKRVCYLNVLAVDRHGIKSGKALKVNFYAERFVNLNQKLFGSKTRFGFKNAKAAGKYQSTFTVKVWKLVSGKKVRAKMSLTVNKEVADEVKKIFAEIYKGKEKFPIKVMGGFQIRSSKSSEHNHGTAIDINPTENCMKDGKKVTSGKFWRPGKNQYSIKPDGDVVKAFEKYGWYWGGHGWGNRKDYMHFSYLGT
jgi:hypothetical protein